MESGKYITTIAIIGGGFSGTMLAVNLLKKTLNPLNVIIIEKNPEPGRGVAYSTDDANHLLNVTADNMSAFPDEPGHFIEWLKDNQIGAEFNLEIFPDSFLPRKIYGLYLQDILQNIQTINNSVLEKINSEAISVDLQENGAIILCKNNQSVFADKVVLALGNYPPGNLPVEDETFYKSKNYFQNPWGEELPGSIAIDEPVLLIGSGLTMVDIVLSLKEAGHKEKIYVISKHGYLPLAHKKVQNYPAFINPENIPLSFLQIFKIVREHIEKAKKIGIDWHAVIDSLRPYSQKIWLSMPVTEKQKFMRYARHRWGVLRHRLPPETAKIFNELLDSGQIKVYAGHIKSFTESENDINVIFKKRGKAEIQEIKVSKVINCTGPEPNINKIDQEIIVDLKNKGLIHPDSLYLGVDATPAGAIINNDEQPSDILFTLGPLLKGILWESTAIPEIRVQASELAELLLKGSGSGN